MKKHVIEKKINVSFANKNNNVTVSLSAPAFKGIQCMPLNAGANSAVVKTLRCMGTLSGETTLSFPLLPPI